MKGGQREITDFRGQPTNYNYYSEQLS